MSSGFVTESELAEARLRRQEEWEKVRTADQPLEMPEEPYDGRSLYERLKEQKIKKDTEYEETHKLKNLIRGLDDDEVQFLELIDQTKMDAERKQKREDEQELKDFRNRVATLQEEEIDKKIKSELQVPVVKSKVTTDSKRSSQKSLLSAGIKRKHPLSNDNKTEEPTSSQPNSTKTDADSNDSSTTIKSNDITIDGHTYETIKTKSYDRGALKCVGILPGIGPYTDSSDSADSSNESDVEIQSNISFDLCGRVMAKKLHCNKES